MFYECFLKLRTHPRILSNLWSCEFIKANFEWWCKVKDIVYSKTSCYTIGGSLKNNPGNHFFCAKLLKAYVAKTHGSSREQIPVVFDVAQPTKHYKITHQKGYSATFFYTFFDATSHEHFELCKCRTQFQKIVLYRPLESSFPKRIFRATSHPNFRVSKARMAYFYFSFLSRVSFHDYNLSAEKKNKCG